MPHKDPEERKAWQAAWRERNREKLRNYHRDRYQNDPEFRAKKIASSNEARSKPGYKEKNREACRRYYVNKAMARSYGLQPGQYDELLKAQDGRCATCGAESASKSKRWLFVDHCHRTGKIRGLLCHHCNSAIGHLRDDVDLILKAADYVKKHQP